MPFSLAKSFIHYIIELSVIIAAKHYRVLYIQGPVQGTPLTFNPHKPEREMLSSPFTDENRALRGSHPVPKITQVRSNSLLALPNYLMIVSAPTLLPHYICF